MRRKGKGLGSLRREMISLNFQLTADAAKVRPSTESPADSAKNINLHTESHRDIMRCSQLPLPASPPVLARTFAIRKFEKLRFVTQQTTFGRLLGRHSNARFCCLRSSAGCSSRVLPVACCTVSPSQTKIPTKLI